MKTHLFVKGIVATAFCMMISLSASQAQSNWGIRAAATTNIANKSFKEMFSGIPTIGVSAGVFGELQLVKFMRLRAELNAAWKGTDRHFWLKDDKDLFYAGIPVLIEFVPIKNLIVGAGAEANYLVAAIGAPVSDYKKWDVGLTFHLEYRLFSRLGISLRYVHGLTKVNPTQITDGQGNASNSFTANRTIQLGLSYSFGSFGKGKK